MSRELAKGVIEAGCGHEGTCWNILGQSFYPKVCCDSSFAFEAVSMPGDFFPVHIHATQDTFLIVLEGVMDVKLDGQWLQLKPGDLVAMPRGIPHGFFNRSDAPARTLFWVSPAKSLEKLFEKLDGVKDVNEVVRLSALHDVVFLPPEAND